MLETHLSRQIAARGPARLIRITDTRLSGEYVSDCYIGKTHILQVGSAKIDEDALSLRLASFSAIRPAVDLPVSHGLFS